MEARDETLLRRLQSEYVAVSC